MMRTAETILGPIVLVILALGVFTGVLLPREAPILGSPRVVAGKDAGKEAGMEGEKDRDESGVSATGGGLAQYWAIVARDRSYRPLAWKSFSIDDLLGARARSTQALQAVLHTAGALLAFLLLRRILEDRRMALLGAALYAVLPVHVETVLSPGGRQALLATIAILGALTVGFVCSDRKGRGRENLALVWALGTLAFVGPFVDAKVLIVGPVLLALLAILRRPLPWLALSATAVSSLAYLSVRHTAVANLMLGVDFIHNPLVAEGNLTRLVNGARLIWHHAIRILEPFSLSADASFRELPVLAASSPWLWVQAAALVGGLGYAIARATRRFPAIVAGLAFYVLTILPHASVFFVAPIIASDRSVHAAGLGLVLALAAAIERIRDARSGGASVPKKRWIPAAALLVVTALLAGRSWIRARDWGDPQSMALRLPEEAPESSWSHQKAAETLLRRLEAGGDTARPEFLEKARQHATRAVEIFPVDLRSESGRAEEVLGRVLLRSRKYAEAAHWFTEASKHLGAQRIPELEPLLYRRRAECFLNLNRPAEALADLDPYILLLAHDKKVEDPLAHNFRGLARGMLGNLGEAIVDFDRALSLRSDIPEFWNNRGYCRFRKKDYRGAIEDYTKGMELCRAQGLIRAAQGHSVTSFLNSMVAVHDSIAAAARAAGDAAGANQASQESMRLRVEAARIADPSTPRDAPRADPGSNPTPGPAAPAPAPAPSPSPAPAPIPAPPVPRP